MDEIIGHPTEIIGISQSSTIAKAAELMLSHNVGCLIVNNDRGRFVGLITERDIAHSVATCSDGLGNITVAQIMTKNMVSCPPGTSTSQACEIMAAHRIRHLPVVDNSIVVGILSARDLMARQLIENRAAAEEVAMLSNCLKSLDLDEAVETIAKEAPKLFGARHCVLRLFAEDTPHKQADLVSRNKCPCQDQHPDDPEQIDWAKFAHADHNDFCWDSIPKRCQDLDAQPPRLLIPLTVSSAAAGASHSDKPLRGYLCMCGLAPSIAADKDLTSYKAALAREILASHLTNAALYHKARITSLTDALTGVGSRKLLEDELEAECARAQRYNRPFSVAIIDLDNLKSINDICGHAAGDDAIRRLAACMKTQKRAPDILVRYGGDEFVILMPETKAHDAVVLLERLRLQVHDIRLTESASLSISCGISQYLTDQDSSCRDVIRRADVALYDAKSAGRDCVKIWDQSMTRGLEPGEIEMEKIKKLQQRIAGLSDKAEKMFMQSIWGLVQALEAKDPYARKHSENVTHYAVAIAEAMELGRTQIDIIRRSAMIHDIGKIGIPDAITSKPGKLTPRERSVIEQHPLIAIRILEKMTFLEQEMDIVRHHHEKWNGQGYPDGLSRTAISIGARILAVADTFDALTSNRSYRRCKSVPEAVKILRDSAGYEFDREVIAVMLTWLQTVAADLDKKPADLTTEDLLHDKDQASQPTPVLVTSSN